jgi:hypothetical protein
MVHSPYPPRHSSSHPDAADRERGPGGRGLFALAARRHRPAAPRRSVLGLGLAALGAALVSACSIEAWCRWSGSTPSLAEVLSAYGLLGPVSRTYEPGKGFGQLMGYLGGSLISWASRERART